MAAEPLHGRRPTVSISCFPLLFFICRAGDVKQVFKPAAFRYSKVNKLQQIKRT